MFTELAWKVEHFADFRSVNEKGALQTHGAAWPWENFQLKPVTWFQWKISCFVYMTFSFLRWGVGFPLKTLSCIYTCTTLEISFPETFENHYIRLALVSVGWDLDKAEASFTLLLVPLFNCRSAQEDPSEYFKSGPEMSQVSRLSSTSISPVCVGYGVVGFGVGHNRKYCIDKPADTINSHVLVWAGQVRNYAAVD